MSATVSSRSTRTTSSGALLLCVSLALPLSSCGGAAVQPQEPLPGKFVEVPGGVPFEFPPLDGSPVYLTSGVIADLDGDGVPEVIYNRWNGAGGGRAVAYSYRDGALVPGFALDSDGYVVAAMDIDGDGIVDLVHYSSVQWGLGGGKFLPSQSFSTNGDISGIGAFWDLDGNGLVDFIANPYCKPVRILLQVTPRQFVDSPALIEPGTNINPNAVFVGTVNGQLTIGSLGFSCVDLIHSVPIFYQLQSGVYKPVGLGTEDMVSTSAMGAATGTDLDGDGQSDFLLSLNPQHLDFSNGKEVKLPFYDVLSDTGQPMIPWSALIFDADLDGRQDVLFTHGADDLGSPQVKGIGKERVTLHRNTPHGFAPFAPLGDLGRLGNWRALGVADIDNDGDADLLVGGFDEDPRLYRNDSVGNAVALRLVEKHGSPAWGAQVSVTSLAGTLRFEVSGIATETVVSEPLIYAGLGASTTAEVDVVWADKTMQHAHVVAGKTTTIVEGK